MSRSMLRVHNFGSTSRRAGATIGALAELALIAACPWGGWGVWHFGAHQISTSRPIFAGWVLGSICPRAAEDMVANKKDRFSQPLWR